MTYIKSTAGGGGAWTTLKEGDLTGVTNGDITNITDITTMDMVELWLAFDMLDTSNEGNVFGRLSSDNGSSFDTANNYYRAGLRTDTSSNYDSLGPSSEWQFDTTLNVGGAVNENLLINIRLWYDINSSRMPTVSGFWRAALTSVTGGVPKNVDGTLKYIGSIPNAFRFYRDFSNDFNLRYCILGHSIA